MLYMYSLLAMSAGCLIAINRAVNARLGQTHGALASSVWNHLIGFLVLIPFAAWMYGSQFLHSLADINPVYYLGGVIGGLFVAINSWIIPKVGAMRTVILVICGQTLAGLAIDLYLHRVKNIHFALFGALLLLAGGSIAKLAASKNQTREQQS